MAEAVGLVIGGVSVAALFDSCMNAFDRIESAKTYGKEYQKCAVKMSLLQLRLPRWEESVSAAASQGNAFTIGTTQDADIAEDLLGEIAFGIEDTEKVAKRYKLKEAPPPQDNKEAATMEALVSRAKNLSIRRQKHSSIGQKTRWALHDQRKFRSLIDDLTHYVSQLEALFPAERFRVVTQTQQRIAESEVFHLVQPSAIEEPGEIKQAIVTILEEVTPDVDGALLLALQKISVDTRRHEFGLINVKGNARVAVGDYVAKGEKPRGHGHVYGVLNADGDSQVHYGNIYGGKSFFND